MTRKEEKGEIVFNNPIGQSFDDQSEEEPVFVDAVRGDPQRQLGLSSSFLM